MKFINNSLVRMKIYLLIFIGFIVMLCTSMLFNSCQNAQDYLSSATADNENTLKCATVPDASTLYWGRETFTRYTGKPITIKKKIGSGNLNNFESDFVLHIQNGNGKHDLISSAVIKIDGKQIFGPSDFSKKVTELTKKIKCLSINSKLEVELRSAPGSYIVIWIEGKLKPKPNCGTVTDIDGNVYHTVTIGTQCWMVENLKVTHYRNGDPIADHQCAYNDEESNVAIYGRLYRNSAVNSINGLAPAGWHVPSDAEWSTLVTYLGGESVAGGKLKEPGTAHWYTPNTAATNESGFKALPGGATDYLRNFYGMGALGRWWSTTKVIQPVTTIPMIWTLGLSYVTGSTVRSENQIGNMHSVRCIKD